MKMKRTTHAERSFSGSQRFVFASLLYLCTCKTIRKGARVVEEARLESVYTSKAYHGFESRPFRFVNNVENALEGNCFLAETFEGVFLYAIVFDRCYRNYVCYRYLQMR